ncbi:hypothetical protein RFI_08314 [Reticulomyxa filosa]|uniref:Uncharacterized protein n=1 Tax=Reticulomyxa filosa TaxID=46433 RepID=X6NSA0_RETFI|nr:hypothetical protein RFI_08314 [Reticulomyxa filosa]|eukprot:ETO28813.1 hypothetical protein RFI_08314 [Reticulomyxa filosa]
MEQVKTNEVGQEPEQLKKEEEKAEIGETKPGINLQGYCINMDCLAAKAHLPVWVNLGFADISFHSDKTSYHCPDCGQLTVTSVIKTMVFNSEHSISASDSSIPVKHNHYQCFYSIKSGLSYEVKAKKIRQHAISLDDLITRSENAMISNEILNLVAELQKYLITVVKPPKVKDSVRLLEKIKCDYNGDYNQVFDVGRFTILCDNATKLQTAVAVMKKAEKFNLIVSEDKDFFERQSKTHHRFHNIKLYVPKHDVYVEMQATLKNFTTLEGYTVIENPKLSHLFYEHIRAWKPKNTEEEDLKQASDEALTKINDVICEWTDDKGIQKLANRYKSHLDIGILKPSQLFKSESDINNNVSLKMAQFVHEQLCKFTPEKMKGKAIYVILYEYYKKFIIGNKNPASCSDFALLLQESRKQEMEEDIAISQALEMYISLQANSYPHIDGDDNEKNDTFDCHQHVIEFLEKETVEEKKREKQYQQQRKVIIIQGKSGSGKKTILWSNYAFNSKQPIPVYISFPKVYNKNNEKDIILQALQGKHISKEIMDAIREKVPFVFIMDGFDEIFDKYNKNENNDKYFYDRFNLNQWNAKVIVTCRSKVLSDEDINIALVNVNQTQNITTSMIDDSNDWTPKKYEETLNNYPNLQKMVEEPFLLQLILTVLPSLVKQYGAGSRISKAKVYEVFNNQWIDIHSENIISKLTELRIQMNINKIKYTLKQYCLDLGFDMFHQGNQVAVEPESQHENNDINTWSKLDPEMESDNKNGVVDEKIEIKTINDTSNSKTQDVWEKYFNGDSIAKYVLRRVGDNKYQFLHKSCQEYYAAQKIIFDIISWKPNIVTIDNQQFQQQFETHVRQLSINRKLLNEELGIIQFIAERIHDISPVYINLKSRLFRIVESSKNNENISIAAANAITILNSANVNMHYRDLSNVKIPYAILDHAFLEGTNFTNANLNNASFYQTCLNKTNFTNGSMNDVYFGEYAYLEGHSNGVNGIKFSPDGLRIVSWSNDETLRIWDTISRQQLYVLTGHSNWISAAQFSSDGSKIVSCAWDDPIRIWDVLSGKQIQLLEGHSDNICIAQFSPDGSKVVSCSEDETIQIWDTSSGKQIHLIEKNANWVEFFPDGSKIAACLENGAIQICDVSSGKRLQILKGHLGLITGIRFTLDGSKIISRSEDNTIRIWDVLSGKQIFSLEGHTKDINGIQLSSDGLKILSCSSDGTIRMWDLFSGRQLQVFEYSQGITEARFSPDSSRIVSSSSDKTIRIWDVSSEKLLQVLEGHSDEINGVEFFPKDNKILSCSKDCTIRIWDIALERKIQLTEEYLANLMDVRLSHDGSKVISFSSDKTIRFWDIQSGKLIQSFEINVSGEYGIQFSLDTSKLVSYERNNEIKIWDVSSGKQLQVLEGHSIDAQGVQFSSDNSKILCYFPNKTIGIWNVISGKRLQVLEERLNYVSKINFSPDGSKVVFYSEDRTLLLWDLLSEKQFKLAKYEHYTYDIKFSSDGSKFAFDISGTLHIWDILSKKQLLLLKMDSPTKDLQFSPSGTKILLRSYDKKIRLLDVLSGSKIHIFDGFSNVLGMQFLPDGSKFISYLEDNTIRIWDVSSGKQIQLLEGHTGGIAGIQLSPDGSKLVSYAKDKTIRLWGSDSGKIIDVNESSRVECIWKVGVQSFGLCMKDSIWKNTNGLTQQQKLLVEQRGGKF